MMTERPTVQQKSRAPHDCEYECHTHLGRKEGRHRGRRTRGRKTRTSGGQRYSAAAKTHCNNVYTHWGHCSLEWIKQPRQRPPRGAPTGPDTK